MDRFERVPHGRYINFVADFLEADKRATRATSGCRQYGHWQEAIAAWGYAPEVVASGSGYLPRLGRRLLRPQSDGRIDIGSAACRQVAGEADHNEHRGGD